MPGPKSKNREGDRTMFDFMTTLETLDGVPQNYQALYTKGDDGKFAIDPVLAKKLDVSGLTTALDKERKANKVATSQLDAWKKLNYGATPEEVATKFTELQEAATKGAEGKTNWDKMKADLDAGHAKVLVTKDGEISAMRTTVEKHLVDNVAITALTEAKGSAALLLPHVRSQVKVFEEKGEYIVRVVDKDGDPRGDGRGGFMTIKDLILEMKSSQEFGRAFEATGTSGSGKQPGSSKTGKEGGAGRDASELNPTQKIALGLQKGQLGRAS